MKWRINRVSEYVSSWFYKTSNFPDFESAAGLHNSYEVDANQWKNSGKPTVTMKIVLDNETSRRISEQFSTIFLGTSNIKKRVRSTILVSEQFPKEEADFQIGPETATDLDSVRFLVIDL